VVALIYGLSTVPALEAGCFISTKEAPVVCLTHHFWEGDFDEEYFLTKCNRDVYASYWKLRMKQVDKFGDKYYEQMSLDETVSKSIHFEKRPTHILKNKRDLEMFVEDNITQKIPCDGPMWRCFVCPYSDPENPKTTFV